MLTLVLKEIVNAMETIRVEDFAEPDTRVGPNDEVVGVMDHNLMKLYTLKEIFHKQGQELARKGMHLLADAMGAAEQPLALAEVKRELALTHQKYEALEKFFWIEVRYAFPVLADKESIGVREGWRVVWTNRTHPPSISDIIELLLRK